MPIPVYIVAEPIGMLGYVFFALLGFGFMTIFAFMIGWEACKTIFVCFVGALFCVGLILIGAS